MKIAVGKIGKSVLFDSNKWGAIGGDNEGPIFLESLFHKNPEHTFYLVGLSDYDRLSDKDKNRINKYNNVINPWDEVFQQWRKTFNADERGEKIAFIDYWRNLETTPKLDVGLFFMGPTATSNVFGKARKVTEPSVLASPLFMQCKYAGPIVDYINEEKLPWVMILNDPRFYPANIKDLFIPPSKILSQYNQDMNHRAWKSYADNAHQNITKVKCEYSAMETIFLIGKKAGEDIVEVPPSLDSFYADAGPAIEPGTKDIEFMIVCNEGRPSRYNDLDKYILKHVKDVEIYGKWDEKIVAADSRFKGPKKFNDLQKLLPRVKYTFCIPIKKGWVTAKFWEMAHYGIIPFLHPTYDEQDNLKCPEFLRISDSADLYKKIKFLNDNPNAYNILRANIDSMLKDSYYDGTELNNITMTALKETQ